VKRRQYEDYFAENYRLRVTRETERGKMFHWAAQLQWFDGESWLWLARLDTAGGKANLDRNLIARHQEVSLPEDPGKALDLAKRHLRKRHKAYTRAYLAAKAEGGKS
jgi:hypothetical protein